MLIGGVLILKIWKASAVDSWQEVKIKDELTGLVQTTSQEKNKNYALYQKNGFA